MSVEITIVCDGCSAIVVAASSVGEARREGKRDGVLFSVNKKDFCAKCHERYRREIERPVKGNQQ